MEQIHGGTHRPRASAEGTNGRKRDDGKQEMCQGTMYMDVQMPIAGRVREPKKRFAPTSGAGYTCGSQAFSGRIWNGGGSRGNVNAAWVCGSGR